MSHERLENLGPYSHYYRSQNSKNGTARVLDCKAKIYSFIIFQFIANQYCLISPVVTCGLDGTQRRSINGSLDWSTNNGKSIMYSE